MKHKVYNNEMIMNTFVWIKEFLFEDNFGNQQLAINPTNCKAIKLKRVFLFH